jgi:hypothetical protein
LNQRWSHGERSSTSAGPNSPPTSPVILAGRGGRVEMLHLAQQATLETRERKHEPRTVTEQRAVWPAGDHEIAVMLQQALNPPVTAVPTVTTDWLAVAADRVMAALEEHRATWQYWHLWAETQRQLRGTATDPADTAAVAAAVVKAAINRSIRLTPVDDPAGLPDQLAGPTLGRCSPSPAVTSTPRRESWALSSFWRLRTAPTAGS